MSPTYMFVLFLWAVVFTTPSIGNGGGKGDHVIIDVDKSDINSVNPHSFEAELNKKPGKPGGPHQSVGVSVDPTIAAQLQKAKPPPKKKDDKKKQAAPAPPPDDAAAADDDSGGDDPEA